MSNTNILDPFQPTAPDTTIDARSVVETEADIANIQAPYEGLIVYCKQTKKHYRVIGLKPASFGESHIVNKAAVGTYTRLSDVNSVNGCTGDVQVTPDSIGAVSKNGGVLSAPARVASRYAVILDNPSDSSQRSAISILAAHASEMVYDEDGNWLEANNKNAMLTLFNKTAPEYMNGDVSYDGSFLLQAATDDAKSILRGAPTGEFQWGDKNIVRSINGVYADDKGDVSLHVGQIIMQSGSPRLPGRYLECTGAAISRSSYSTLFEVIGTTYGSGDGTTTFNIPDMRGVSLVNADGSNVAYAFKYYIVY